jgi:hypothetical protein
MGEPLDLLAEAIPVERLDGVDDPRVKLAPAFAQGSEGGECSCHLCSNAGRDGGEPARDLGVAEGAGSGSNDGHVTPPHIELDDGGRQYKRSASFKLSSPEKEAACW